MPQETQVEEVVLHPETERKFTKLTSIKDVRRKVSSGGALTSDMLADPVSGKSKPSPRKNFRDEGSSFMIREALVGVNNSSAHVPRAPGLPWYENAQTLALVGFASVLAAGLLTLLISLPFRG